MPKKKPKKTVRRKTKKAVRKKKARKISSIVKIREITVRFGGVVRTGAYENRRLSYEMTATCPRSIAPSIVCDYLEAIAANQFYQAQLKALEGLPDEIRDEVGDVSRLSPQQAARKIADFFRNFGLRKPLTAKEKTERIAVIQAELKELAPKIRKETAHLKRKKDITGDDLHDRQEMISHRDELKKELKLLRSK